MGEELEEITEIKTRPIREENPYDDFYRNLSQTLSTNERSEPPITQSFTPSAPLTEDTTDIMIEMLDLWKKTLQHTQRSR